MAPPKGWKHPRRVVVTCACTVCGKAFETKQWRVNQGKGRYCSKDCYRIGSRREEGVEHDGLWFGRDPRNGYYWCKMSDKTSVSLHHHVWIKAHGLVPTGYVIHHKNHNDQACTDINGLELMETKAHARHHAAERKRKRLQGSA
jgi:hypothetical protein